jgi:hypothetical protein
VLLQAKLVDASPVHLFFVFCFFSKSFQMGDLQKETHSMLNVFLQNIICDTVTNTEHTQSFPNLHSVVGRQQMGIKSIFWFFLTALMCDNF